MVEEGNYAVPVASVHKFTDKVTACRGVHNVKFGEAIGIVEGEALVMTRSKGDIFASGSFCGENEFVRIEILSGEGVRKLLILVHIAFVSMVGPFAYAKLGIESPMRKHSEAEIFKISYSF
jgi:hypothetical protein